MITQKKAKSKHFRSIGANGKQLMAVANKPTN